MVRPNGVKEVKVIETKAMCGLGAEKDPARVVTQYWDLDGKFLAEANQDITSNMG